MSAGIPGPEVFIARASTMFRDQKDISTETEDS
jgi:hypothetical protein